MTARDRVYAGLDASGVPAWFGAWVATDEYPTPPPCYIVFTTMSHPSKYEDDGISEWRHYAYLEMWATGGYAVQMAAVRESMLEAGFAVDTCREGYEQDTGCSHISMSFVLIGEVA